MVAQQSLTTLDGVIGARNDRGLRLQGEAEWRNLSKFCQPAPIIPNVGLPVRLELDRSGFVRGIETLTGSAEKSALEPPTQAWDVDVRAESSAVAPADKDTQIRRMNALGHAVATLATHSAISPDDVLALAERYERWICR